MMATPKVSIIVPVYNSEAYLPECVESIVGQTYSDWELLLIDDGSIDGSEALCDRYAAMDERIRVVHKENGGASSARNLGISMAKGDKLMFVDSDDYIGSGYLESLLAYDSDIVVSGFTTVSDAISVPHAMTPGTFDREDFGTGFASQETVFYYFTWGRLFDAHMIKSHNLHYDESLKIAEDATLSMQIFATAQSLSFSESCGYYYRQHSGSLTNTAWNFDTRISSYYSMRDTLVGNEQSFMERDLLSFYTSEVLGSMETALNQLFADHGFKERAKTLPTIDMDFYNSHVRGVTWKDTFIKRLLKYRLYTLYNIIRGCI